MNRLDRLFPVRHRTIAGGVALGGLLITALTLAGVLGASHRQKQGQAAGVRQTDTITASQPELQAALLAPIDLPASYAPQPPAASPKPKPPKQERCAALLSAPDELIRTAAATVSTHPKGALEPSAQAVSKHRGPTLITQVLATFTGDGAATTLGELRRLGQRCRDFNAVLDDGTAVRVRVDDVPRDSLPAELLKLEGDAYAVRFTLTGKAKTMTGYLALGRVGGVLSGLREMDSGEPTGAVADLTRFTGLLEQAARKLLPITLGAPQP
ncbi:hypothetical protein ACFQY4_40405 [Catellatospora bangladeshensis]|uniref:Uncharacterized protein n=1 Tax=Catellatospora bangladeshensis TaxID=310355 RepID=A0A8J3JU32_9ACTN|nr:hypothetical protein [Catellatospora bangladeshensis]GIF83779.1 hypothetical protein Cba03nite_51280 [Catellatospora bangladeshensis]